MFTIVVSIVSLTYDASITVTLKACVDKSLNRQRAVILYGIMYLSHMVELHTMKIIAGQGAYNS